MKREIAILGGGSWGTVLANLASINGNKVTLWMRDEINIKSINETNLNIKYLPDYLLDENLLLPAVLKKLGLVYLFFFAFPVIHSRKF